VPRSRSWAATSRRFSNTSTVASFASALGLSQKQLEELAATAKMSARVMGVDTAQAFEALATGVANGNVKMLRQAGIFIDVEKAQEAYARQIGTTSDRLSEAGERAAIFNAVMDQQHELSEKLGDITDTNVDKFEKFLTSIGSIASTMKSEMIPAFETLIDKLQPLLSSVEELLKRFGLMRGAAAIFAIATGNVEAVASVVDREKEFEIESARLEAERKLTPLTDDGSITFGEPVITSGGHTKLTEEDKKLQAAIRGLEEGFRRLALATPDLATTIATVARRAGDNMLDLANLDMGDGTMPDTTGGGLISEVMSGRSGVFTQDTDVLIDRIDDVQSLIRYEKEAAEVERQRAALIQQYSDAQTAAFEAEQRRIDQLLAFDTTQIAADVASGIFSGSAFSAGLGGLGAQAGQVASVALGDPTGMIGGALGAGAGSALGGLIDNLEPLVQGAQAISDAFAFLIEAMEPVFEPLEIGAAILENFFTTVVREHAGPWFRALGSILESFFRVAYALEPLVSLFYSMNPAVDVLVGGINLLALTIEGIVSIFGVAYDAVRNFSIGLIDFINDVTKDSIDMLVELEDELKDTKSWTDLMEQLDEQIRSDEDLGRAIEDNTKAVDSFSRQNFNLPAGYKGQEGAEFAAADHGRPNVIINIREVNARENLATELQRLADYAASGSIYPGLPRGAFDDERG
jgi:hypothetical protein